MFNLIQDRNVQLCKAAVCLSTDDKSEDGFGNGDFLIEMDTGKTYIFNADGAEDSKWVEF